MSHSLEENPRYADVCDSRPIDMVSTRTGVIQRARLYGQSESQLPMVLAAATAKQLSSKPTPDPMCAIKHASSEPCCCIAVE